MSFPKALFTRVRVWEAGWCHPRMSARLDAFRLLEIDSGPMVSG